MISFDELYANRIYYQDISFDEYFIIKKLKILLIEDGMTEEDTNKYLFDFYKSFGNEMSLEDIKNVTLYERNNNILTSFFNLIDTDNLESISEENNSDNNNSDNNNQNNISDINNDDNNNSDINNDNEHYQVDYMNLTIPIDLNNTNIGQSLNNAINLNAENSNFVFSFLPNNNLINNTNIVNQILSNMTNIVNNTNNTQEDVNITMDKDDIDNLEILKYSSDKNTSCSICLMDVEKDDEIFKIKCDHFFHKDCLEKWLSDYNYLCPICRTELGKSKAHIDNEDAESYSSVD